MNECWSLGVRILVPLSLGCKPRVPCEILLSKTEMWKHQVPLWELGLRSIDGPNNHFWSKSVRWFERELEILNWLYSWLYEFLQKTLRINKLIACWKIYKSSKAHLIKVSSTLASASMNAVVTAYQSTLTLHLNPWNAMSDFLQAGRSWPKPS